MFTLQNNQLIWPIIGCLFFILAFAVVIIRVIRLDAKSVAHLERLPLGKDESENTFAGKGEKYDQK